MNNFISAAVMLFSLVGCVTGSGGGSSEAERAKRSKSVFLTDSASKKSELVSYDKKKIASLVPKKEDSKHITAQNVLYTAFVGENMPEISKKAMEFSGTFVSLKNPTLPEDVTLALGLSALKQKNLNLAVFFLEKSQGAKNAHVRAAAFSAMGVIAYQENHLREAMEWWKKSLAEDADNSSARLNLASILLQYRRYPEAKTLLLQEKAEWGASLYALAAFWGEGAMDQAKGVCDSLSADTDNAIVLFNCGLFFSQDPSWKKKAKSLLEKFVEISSAPANRKKIASELLTHL